MYDVLCLGMCDRHRDSAEQPQSDVPPFLIPEAVVLERERGSGEDLLDVNEVDPVVLEVLPTLRLVPLVSHLRSVYTLDAESNYKGPLRAR
jgi:hypothetical protein